MAPGRRTEGHPNATKMQQIPASRLIERSLVRGESHSGVDCRICPLTLPVFMYVHRISGTAMDNVEEGGRTQTKAGQPAEATETDGRRQRSGLSDYLRTLDSGAGSSAAGLRWWRGCGTTWGQRCSFEWDGIGEIGQMWIWI